MVAPAVVVSLFVDNQNKPKLFHGFPFCDQFFQLFLVVSMKNQQVSTFERRSKGRVEKGLDLQLIYFAKTRCFPELAEVLLRAGPKRAALTAWIFY